MVPEHGPGAVRPGAASAISRRCSTAARCSLARRRPRLPMASCLGDRAGSDPDHLARRRTLYELLRPRALRSVLIGRSRRIPGTALTDFVAALEDADSPA